MKTKLCCVTQNHHCKIIEIFGDNRDRLSTLGFSKNLTIYVELVTNDIMKIKCRDYYIALRKNEAEKIIVEILQK
jgi:Fe2+ transport system protein FeoA